MKISVASALLSVAVTVSAIPRADAAESAAIKATLTPPDATLYTNYYFVSDYQMLYFSVCGSLPQSYGCYSSGGFGPFVHVGGLVEGYASWTGDVVRRNLYIVDTQTGESGTGVTLYVYQKTDSLDASYDTVSTKLVKKVALPLVGGSNALVSIAANKNYVFVGTDQSDSAVRIRKGTLEQTLLGGFSPPISVGAITTNDYGYVTVSYYGTAAQGGGSGNYVYGPEGNLVSDGGGALFMLSSTTGLSTKTPQLPLFDTPPTLKGVTLKNAGDE